MTLVPKAIFEKCILLGMEVHDRKLSAKDALATAVALGSNPTSANDTFRCVQYMTEGKRYLRGLSVQGTDFALAEFHRRQNRQHLENALQAVEAHIAHDQTRAWHSLRSVVAKYRAFLAVPSDLASLIAAEASALRDALSSSPTQRAARLAAANPIPKTATVTTTVYLRNAEVVATVLLRAAGICEGCSRAAPFLRRSDNSPYLEVHHRTPLAEGGTDTVDNAIALCPNCHRKAHHGHPPVPPM